MRADGLRDELKRKIVQWLISFHRLDPRYKILTFFNQVAKDGADDLTNDYDEDQYHAPPPEEAAPPTAAERLARDAFDTTSILTVWRPCSNDAMRKMMEGTGVGKGLDIKGKSAKRGELSAFVPFLQIHAEEDKGRIARIGRGARLRLYLTSAEARVIVRDRLEPLATAATGAATNVVELNDFVARGFWGLEMNQRLFWKGFVEDANIERDAATETGRPSYPAFQDANLKTLKCATARGSLTTQASSISPLRQTDPQTRRASSISTIPPPRPVVLQHSRDNPFSPQHLLMAYEENGTIAPVVSDFDGFLLGWRREALWFGCRLPDEQVDLMVWCVDQIEKSLDDAAATDSASGANWTATWLEVLKRNSDVHPQIPRYGFGDPKSYGIMENAALQLLDTGAVRHGAECFNYHFPQEIDETFLIVSDTLKPVPWTYVNVAQLQRILSARIQEGFVFPLNPKWILCDPGWKELYDRLMSSEALYADYAKDVWYPPHSGVREKIERICQKHPGGFGRDLRRQMLQFRQERRRFTSTETSARRPTVEAFGQSLLRQGALRQIETHMSRGDSYNLAQLKLEALKTSSIDNSE